VDDHHTFAYRHAGHMLQCQCNGLSSYSSRDVSSLALHGLDDRWSIGAIGVRSEEYWVPFLDGATIEQAVHHCADVRHGPDICH
jgi:hypothetical protein